MRILFLSLLIVCGCKPAHPKPAPLPVTVSIAQQFEDASHRLSSEFIDDKGFIVSRGTGETAEDVGDALIWTGLGAYALDCPLGAVLSDSLRYMIMELGGGIYRHPTLKDNASLDGALGLFRGIAKRITLCNEAEVWKNPLAKLQNFERLTAGRLNPVDSAVLPAEFDYVRDLLLAKLQLAGEPPVDRLRALEQELTAWALAVKETKSACYRANLGLITLQTVEELGGSISKAGRDGFCDVTDGLNLATIDQWCGRIGPLEDFLNSFQYDTWVYRHQRCLGWEHPDANGTKTPGLDRLVAFRQLYNL